MVLALAADDEAAHAAEADKGLNPAEGDDAASSTPPSESPKPDSDAEADAAHSSSSESAEEGDDKNEAPAVAADVA
jgi:hypothetical protein